MNDVTPLSATTRIVAELRRSIITGERRPGEKLKIEELRELLGVGATPIREALSLLTSDKLVERIEQRGFRVAVADAGHFADILLARRWLEERALRESIKIGGEQWEEGLVIALHRLNRAERSTTRDPFADGTWESRHKEFHLALLSACGSATVLTYCSELYDLNVRYRYLAAASKGYDQRDVSAEHAAIVDASIDRDADRAVAALLEHYDRTGRYLSGAA